MFVTNWDKCLLLIGINLPFGECSLCGAEADAHLVQVSVVEGVGQEVVLCVYLFKSLVGSLIYLQLYDVKVGGGL